MSGKMKAIIGSSIGLVLILVLVLIFTLGTSSISPKEFAMESLTLADQAADKVKVATTKEDLKAIYKETLPEFLDMIPGALIGAKEYVESKGGHEKMMTDWKSDPRKASAVYMEEFQEVVGKATAFALKMESLSRDDGFEDRMEMIFKTFTDLDYNDIVTFTMTEYKSLINEVANNDEALQALNWYIAAATPPKYIYPDEDDYKVRRNEWGGYDIDWEAYDRDIKEIPQTPIVLTKEKLLSLSAIVETSFANVKSERDLDKAMRNVEKSFKKEFGFRIIDF